MVLVDLVMVLVDLVMVLVDLVMVLVDLVMVLVDLLHSIPSHIRASNHCRNYQCATFLKFFQPNNKCLTTKAP